MQALMAVMENNLSKCETGCGCHLTGSDWNLEPNFEPWNIQPNPVYLWP